MYRTKGTTQFLKFERFIFTQTFNQAMCTLLYNGRPNKIKHISNIQLEVNVPLCIRMVNSCNNTFQTKETCDPAKVPPNASHKTPA